MANKVLTIDYDKCTGCRTCEMACSLQHEAAVNPSLSRIQVIKGDIEGEGIPMVCAQCDPAPCLDACPTNARCRDEESGRVVTDDDRCIRCRTCVAVCPFGAIGFNPTVRKIFSCDQCDGTPQCAEFCSYDALHYVDESDVNRQLAKDAAARVTEAKQRLVRAQVS